MTAAAALAELLVWLDAHDYDFVAPTPLTHGRAMANGATGHDTLRDLFGWSVPVTSVAVDLLVIMRRAGVAIVDNGKVRSSVRVSRLDGRLFLHSAHPTSATDAVFLGPDSYRFARLLNTELANWCGGGTLVDLGTGAGVGAIVGGCVARADRVVATDINPAALALAAINARHAGCVVELIESVGLPDIVIDLAVANPPFLVDDSARSYRHGGGLRGCGVALAMAQGAMARLVTGGRLVLYTGTPIIGGIDPFRGALVAAVNEAGCQLRYDEIDPDIFGEELDRPAYAGVERIALVAAVAVKT